MFALSILKDKLKNLFLKANGNPDETTNFFNNVKKNVNHPIEITLAIHYGSVIETIADVS